MSKIGFVQRFVAILLCALITLAFTSCVSKADQQTTSSAENSSLEISVPSMSPSANPSPYLSGEFVTNLTKTGIGIVRDVPPFSCSVTQPTSFVDSFDIRWLDCPKYLNDDQFQELVDAIPNVTFNSDTVWPSDIPPGYDYSAIMEAGKKPGLGIDALHSEGITGKGVSIAIIDQLLFTDHSEYKDNLALYEEIHVAENEQASMHGSAVSSIAVGKTCGVAPDAKLYYWAVKLAKAFDISDISDSNIAFADGMAVAIDRMLEVNAALPENEKIRVLSISRGFIDLSDAGVQILLEAIGRAKEAGIFVIMTSSFQYYDFISQDTDFAGLGKADFSGNPDDLSTYTLGNFELGNAKAYLNKLLVPMDARTTADPSGTEDYAFYPYGGYSWVAPYLAGLYTLAIQVKPDITPVVFWDMALDTSSKLTVTIDDGQYTFNHVINPTGLINALK